MSKHKKIIAIIVTTFIFLPLSVFGYFYTKVNSMYENSDLNIINDDSDKVINDILLDNEITNILLIGTDGRTKSEQGRSDSMMIATIDEKHKSLKLTSLARDTLVKIPGHGEEKLNHAYSYGGAPLLMKTIENNFGVGISSYVNVNFASFMEIIDSLGGISIDVKKSEIDEINKYIPECYNASSSKNKSKMKLLENSGLQVLNGYQALSYSRIRKNDSAFERDGRQRKVLQSLLNEISVMSFGEASKVANSLFPYVKTNIKPFEMIKLVGKVLKIGNFNIKQLEFPIAEYSKGGIVNGKGWVIQFNNNKCLKILHEFIFGEDLSSTIIYENIESNNEYEIESIEEDFLEFENEDDSKKENDLTSENDNKTESKPDINQSIKPELPQNPPSVEELPSDDNNSNNSNNSDNNSNNNEEIETDTDNSNSDNSSLDTPNDNIEDIF